VIGTDSADAKRAVCSTSFAGLSDPVWRAQAQTPFNRYMNFDQIDEHAKTDKGVMA